MASRTIFALSSAVGRSALAVIRVSGPKALPVLKTLMGLSDVHLRPRRLFATRLYDPLNSELVDKAMAVWMPAPATYTGEDSCELYVHGGAAVIDGVLTAIGRVAGTRPADPGEFTRRAFENGRLDLTELEGVADLLNAETVAQRRLALRQVDGHLHQQYEGWRQRLVTQLANVEAVLDFGEEDHLDEGVLSTAEAEVAALRDEVATHARGGRAAAAVRSGVSVTIAGEPNVGKSTLFNALCQSHSAGSSSARVAGMRPAAIVTPIAGTTRDALESRLCVDGFPVLLTDTAGLRAAADPIEQEGVRRALHWFVSPFDGCGAQFDGSLRSADIALFVFNAADLPAPPSPRTLADFCGEQLRLAYAHLSDADDVAVPFACVAFVNKADLVGWSVGSSTCQLRICDEPVPVHTCTGCLLDNSSCAELTVLLGSLLADL